MQNTTQVDALKNIGLSENEAKVYFAALSLGPSSILKIAKAAEIKRTTAYSVIESLKQKGLMNIELKGNKKLFSVENPEKLERVLESRRAAFKNHLSEFTALYNLKEREGLIKYYEGLEAIKSVYEGLITDIRPGEDYLVIADQRQWLALDEKYFMGFIQRRAKLNIKIRMLLTDSKTARDHQKIQAKFNETIKILPKNTTLTTNLVVTPQGVAIHQLIPPVMAIVIENQSIIKMHRELFEIIWNSIKD